MQRNVCFTILFALFCFFGFQTVSFSESNGAPPVNQATLPLPPGSIIATSPDFRRLFLTLPAVTLLPDGSIVASHVNWDAQTDVYRSEDRGKTWKKWSEIPGYSASTIFVYENSLYALGTMKGGNWGIRRGDDGGKTWSEARDSRSGILLQGKYHAWAAPILIHQGRLWTTLEHVRAYTENETPAADWSRILLAMMASVPLDADWMDVENWTFSNALPFPFEHWDGLGWLEGNPLADPAGKVVNVIRVEQDGADKAAILNCSDDGKTLTVDLKNGLIDLPGGSTKFTIRYDDKTGKYWTISNKQKDPPMQRNMLVLACSDDLRSWEVRTILLRHHDRRNHAWQYIDWAFDGEDLIFVSRTAWDGPRGWHDANYVTFHRAERFRELTRQDDAAWLGDYVSMTHETERWKIEIFGQNDSKPEIGIFQNGERAFTNENHLWQDVPKQYEGRFFIRGVIGRSTVIHATAKESGEMLIAHEAVTVATQYRYREWMPVSTASCRYSESNNSRLFFSSRKVEKGDTIVLPMANSFAGQIFIF